MSAAGPTTATLTRALAAGNESAFREFHSRYFDRLYRFLLGVTGGQEHAAQDALQETFLRVAKRAREFEDDEVFWSWLKAVARNAARDGGRKHRRYLAVLERFQPVASVPETDLEDWRAWLADGLAALDLPDRRLVEGKYLEGSTVAELARATGLTLKSVESRLARIRHELAGKLLKNLDSP